MLLTLLLISRFSPPETLRLYPPVGMINKQTIEADDVNGIHIPANTWVGLVIAGVHTNTAVWGDDADRFRPERFNEMPPDVVSANWIPFALGPRNCIGMTFALNEIKTMAAALLRNVTIALDEDHPVVPREVLTLRPEFDVLVSFERRVL